MHLLVSYSTTKGNVLHTSRVKEEDQKQNNLPPNKPLPHQLQAPTLHIIISFATCHPFSSLEAPMVRICKHYFHKNIVMGSRIEACYVETQERKHPPEMGKRKKKRDFQRSSLQLFAKNSCRVPLAACFSLGQHLGKEKEADGGPLAGFIFRESLGEDLALDILFFASIRVDAAKKRPHHHLAEYCFGESTSSSSCSPVILCKCADLHFHHQF